MGLTMASGYWTNQRLAIWQSMTPEQRDYDRYVGRHPSGQGLCETESGRLAIFQRDDPGWDDGCRCHINAPCNACTSAP